MPLGKLSSSEQVSFQAMYDQVASGRVIGLSPKQRSWVEAVYDKHDLDKERPPARKVEIKDKSLVSALDRFPKPLKPPGR